MEERLLNTHQLSKALNVSAQTVHRLRKQGTIPYVSLSRHSYRYNIAHVMEALQKENDHRANQGTV